MRKYLLLLFPLLVVACKNDREVQTEIDVREGTRQLVEARAACLAGHYEAARDSIKAMRLHHRLAIEARRQGILLLDSIELFAARDSFSVLQRTPASMDSASYANEYERLSLKVKFFERKLQEDSKKSKPHHS